MGLDSYISKINQELRPNQPFSYTALDLFAGCGGLSLGFEAAGFMTLGREMIDDYCTTYNQNLKGKCIKEYLTVDSKFPRADIVIGGPPCQPFSVRGNQNGKKDTRDGFPVFIEAIKQVRPRFWMFENVRGLLYRNKWYLDKIIQELESLDYEISFDLLNAANYGIPQNRKRVFVAGYKGNFQFPKTHAKKVTAGEALGELAFQFDSDSKFLTPSMDEYVAKYERASKCITPRDLHLNKPARTLTCRNLAGSTSDMHRIKLPDGRRRRITIREAARLQSFPDWFEFVGSETSQYYQIGNAVPPYFALQIAKQVRKFLDNEMGPKKPGQVRVKRTVLPDFVGIQ